MSQDSIKKTMGVALGVCLICSILVSSTAVSLSSIQENNKRIDKIKIILVTGGLYKENMDVQKEYAKSISSEIIDLPTGEVYPKEKYNNELNVENYDLKKIAADPKYNISLTPDQDIAGIRHIPKDMLIYKVLNKGELQKYILPVYGKGLWSTMYGFLAIDKDLKTVRGISFYEHGETPGLGGEIDNPKWQALWNGKIAFDNNGKLLLEVIKSTVDPTNPNANSQIDGLSGATLTTRGVDHMVKFWLGDNGYGPFFEKLRKEGADEKI